MEQTKQAGKGSKPRPINKKQYNSNYEGINWKKLNEDKKSIESPYTRSCGELPTS